MTAWRPLDLDDPDEPWQNTDPAEQITAIDLAALLTRPAWHTHAACRGKGTAPFFPSHGQSAREARRICAGCPVVHECAQAGEHESEGVWGGLTARERRRLRQTA